MVTMNDQRFNEVIEKAFWKGVDVASEHFRDKMEEGVSLSDYIKFKIQYLKDQIRDGEI